MSPFPHKYLPINFINNILLSISHYKFLISPIPHNLLPINFFKLLLSPSHFITNIFLSMSNYKYSYATTSTQSVTNEFYYQYYSLHLTLYLSLYHPSHRISYQSIPILKLCCLSHKKYIHTFPLQTISYKLISLAIIFSLAHFINILMSPFPHNQLRMNYITNIILTISLYKHP
jgi:hypothetical protein